jgi:4-hydroxybenzoyl-CoA reductase subunit beta
MMVLPKFHLLQPISLEEALGALSQNPNSFPVAGGTDLLVSMKHGLFQPTHLVDIKRVPETNRFEITDDGATLGACLPLSFLRDNPEVRIRYPSLSQAAGLVASPPIQNRATLGGNVCLDTRCWYYNQSSFWRQSRGYCLKKDGDICQAVPGSKRCFAACSSDTAPALIALNARVVIARLTGGVLSKKEIQLEDFFVEDGIHRNALRSDELVTMIRLPGSEGLRSGYLKYRKRASIDYPLVSVAASLRIVEGKIKNARVVVGTMASAPILAAETMGALEGGTPHPDLIHQAAELVNKGTRPVKNQAGSPAHRRYMARVLCRNLLKKLLTGPRDDFF